MLTVAEWLFGAQFSMVGLIAIAVVAGLKLEDIIGWGAFIALAAAAGLVNQALIDWVTP